MCTYYKKPNIIKHQRNLISSYTELAYGQKYRKIQGILPSGISNIIAHVMTKIQMKVLDQQASTIQGIVKHNLRQRNMYASRIQTLFTRSRRKRWDYLIQTLYLYKASVCYITPFVKGWLARKHFLKTMKAVLMLQRKVIRPWLDRKENRLLRNYYATLVQSVFRGRKARLLCLDIKTINLLSSRMINVQTYIKMEELLHKFNHYNVRTKRFLILQSTLKNILLIQRAIDTENIIQAITCVERASDAGIAVEGSSLYENLLYEIFNISIPKKLHHLLRVGRFSIIQKEDNNNSMNENNNNNDLMISNDEYEIADLAKIQYNELKAFVEFFNRLDIKQNFDEETLKLLEIGRFILYLRMFITESDSINECIRSLTKSQQWYEFEHTLNQIKSLQPWFPKHTHEEVNHFIFYKEYIDSVWNLLKEMQKTFDQRCQWFHRNQ